jgi:hypothetical protein
LEGRLFFGGVTGESLVSGCGLKNMFVSAVGILAESLLKVAANLVALLLLCESLEMLEMDWGDNRKIVDSAKHVVVVASGEIESCNSGSDAGARIALEVTQSRKACRYQREESLL